MLIRARNRSLHPSMPISLSIAHFQTNRELDSFYGIFPLIRQNMFFFGRTVAFLSIKFALLDRAESLYCDRGYLPQAW